MLPARLICRVRQACVVNRVSRQYSTQTGLDYEPLRILFCGADDFSIYSLKALQAFQHKRPDKVESIEVVCRPDKYFGTGFKTKQAVPIKPVALALGLPFYQLDSFDNQSFNSNLIVTASFGLLVPARILQSARYGGINVHPSLLPELRGAAPVQHALLRRMKKTGISIQTMHPTKFDHGMIMVQESVNLDELHRREGLPLSYQAVIDYCGPLAADLLVDSLEQGLFMEPQSVTASNNGIQSSKAPKISPEDRKIDWKTWTADEILVRSQALGQLWDTERFDQFSGKTEKIRLSYDAPWKQHDPNCDKIVKEKWDAALLTDGENESRRARQLAFRTVDGVLISPTSASIAGKAKYTGMEALQRMLERREKT